MPGGHPEGYIEGFANFYRDAAEVITARRAGRAPEPEALAALPDVIDGARGIAFIEAAVRLGPRTMAHGLPRGYP